MVEQGHKTGYQALGTGCWVYMVHSQAVDVACVGRHTTQQSSESLCSDKITVSDTSVLRVDLHSLGASLGGQLHKATRFIWRGTWQWHPQWQPPWSCTSAGWRFGPGRCGTWCSTTSCLDGTRRVEG